MLGEFSQQSSPGTSCSSTKPFQPFPSWWSWAVGRLVRSHIYHLVFILYMYSIKKSQAM